VRDDTDLDTWLVELVAAIQQTTEPESVSVWLKPVDGRRPTTDHGQR